MATWADTHLNDVGVNLECYVVIQVNWHVGSRCRCTYSADGLIYDAVIISLADENMCTVRYNYYNNEEQQRLCDLLPPSGDASDIHNNSSRMGSDVSNWYYNEL